VLYSRAGSYQGNLASFFPKSKLTRDDMLVWPALVHRAV